MDNTPACKNFKIWEGPEVEGVPARGCKTLFIRSTEGIEEEHLLALFTGRIRIWFCAEFTLKETTNFIKWFDWFQVREVKPQLVIEVTDENLFEKEIIPYIAKACRRYFKLGGEEEQNALVKDGDVFCFGAPYSETCYTLSERSQTLPTDYNQDRRLV